MEAITYEELMEVNGGRRVRRSGRVRGRRTSWWSRNKKKVWKDTKAVYTGASVGGTIGTLIGRIAAGIIMN